MNAVVAVLLDDDPRRALSQRFGYRRFDPDGSSRSTDDDAGDSIQLREAEPIAIRCFGTFTMSLPGSISIEELRPRARDVLRLLALHCPEPVHRDLLVSAFWRDDTDAVARRKLQVAVSSIRGLLDPVAVPGARSAIGYHEG
ncbi:MAG: hypothetical protein GY741_16920, partial [Phycisphaeraceae bacterium]|nr:hypothetical protein [Phycisphaeraceae bacterium]